MEIGSGKLNGTSIQYSHRDGQNSYEGILFDDAHAEQYLSTRVYEKFHDLKLTRNLTEQLDIAESGFNGDFIRDIVQTNPDYTGWKIGECIAECFLEDDKQARFYHHFGRDLKNQKASPTGVDLVGIANLNGETVFLFGEVKTSGSAESPPSVMRGESGMMGQLGNIKDSQTVRSDLIRWLEFKCLYENKTDEAKHDFIAALKSYYTSENKKLALVGILIRDTAPHERDLQLGYDGFYGEITPEMSLGLSALYFPIRIDEFENFLKRTET